tara:strand:+ start:114 stop:1244 length:1131 start_codon:yes stop_codon:yes gene_type:complete
MKYLFFVGSFYPAQEGGPDTSLYWLTEEISKKNSVTIITFLKGISNKNLKKFSIKPNTVNKFKNLNIIYCKYYIFRFISPYFYYWIIKNIKKYKIININSIFFYHSLFLIFLLTIFNKEYYLTTRGELEDGAIKFKKLFKYFYLIILKFLKKPVFIQSTSLQEKNFNIKNIKYKSNHEIFRNYFKKNKYAHEISNKSNQILYLGRLHPKKGIENLIKSFDMLSHIINEKNIILNIAGKGSLKYEKYLKKISIKNKNNIKFLGHLDLKEKYKIISQSKVLVLPSFSENFGIVVLESLSCGVPVIASKYTPWKILKRYNAGFHIDNNPKEISKFLIEIIELNNDDYKNKQINAINLYKKFKIENNINKFYKLIKKYYE